MVPIFFTLPKNIQRFPQKMKYKKARGGGMYIFMRGWEGPHRQTHRQTHTDKHRDSRTESAQWANSVKIKESWRTK